MLLILIVLNLYILQKKLVTILTNEELKIGAFLNRKNVVPFVSYLFPLYVLPLLQPDFALENFEGKLALLGNFW